jgi:Family of unknown function (DUF6600)/FecR protein
MRAQKIKLMAGIVVAALALAGLPLFGQGQTETSTGVGRVSLIQGDVSMERGDANEWVAVTVNTPLVPGDTIATGAGSHAEVQLDYSNVLRLSDNAEVKIADLNASRIQIQVARGAVDLAVFKNSQANAEVDTPNVAVEPLQEGTYRIDVNSNELSLITVREGQAQISTPQGSTNINAGQQITVEGAQNPQYQIVDAQPLDAWDNWNRDRNGVINSAQSYSHVNRYYTGAQDLDTYGHWSYVPGYDWCWTPYVNAGWVPYSSGRWVWEPYYGWTWVSYDPWGWAPYHYGRWFYYGSNWCWWPGYVTPYYRPLWAPAYVSFFGFGYGRYHYSYGYGYGYRSIGWCPLGPRDEFHRWWGHGGDRSFNAINFNNHYGRGGGGGRGGRGGYGGSNMAQLGSNFHVRRAIVSMPSDRFGREAVPRDHRVVSTAMLRNANVVHGTLPVVPTRDSLRVTNRAANVSAATRNRANNTNFFTRRTVAAPNSNRSFNNQAASIRRMVETHNVQAPGANRQATNTGANRGFQTSRPAGPQNQGNAARQNPAPVVRGNQQGRQNGGPGSGSSTQAGQPNFRQFGTGAPAGQSSGNQGHQSSAPVVRGNPQQRQNVTTGNGRNAQPNQPNFRQFGTGAPATQPGGNQGRQNSAPVVRENPQQRQNVAPRSQPNNNGFHRFTPQPAPQSAPQNQGRFNNNSRPAPQSNNGNSAGWNQFRQQSQAPQQRGGGFYNGGSRTQGYSQPGYGNQPNYNNSRNYSRPPLQLNKPIVSEPRSRSYGGYGGGSRPSYQQRSAPSYSSAPRGGSAPSYRGNSGGGNRGSYSAPSRSSGGGRSVGGGAYSGGGGHSGGGGGYSGGGGHSSGGGGHSSGGGGGGGGHRH